MSSIDANNNQELEECGIAANHLNLSFWSLFIVQFFGALNDNLLKSSLFMMATFHGLKFAGLENGALITVLSGLFVVPFILLSGIAGQVCDSRNKANLTRWVKLSEVLIMLLVAWGLYLEQVSKSQPLLLVMGLFLMAIHSTFFGPIKYSLLPEIVSRSQLSLANAFFESGTFIAILIGTLGGAVIVTHYPSNLAVFMLLNALIGLIFSFGVKYIPKPKVIKISWNPFYDLRHSKSWFSKAPELKGILFEISWFWFVGAGVLTLIGPMSKVVLLANEDVMSLFLGLFTLGIGVGSFLASRLLASHGLTKVKTYGLLGMTAALICLITLLNVGTPRPFVPWTIIQFVSLNVGGGVSIALFLFSVFSGLYTLPLYIGLQTQSEQTNRSRVIATNNIINSFYMVLSSLLLSFLFGAVSVLRVCIVFFFIVIIVQCGYLLKYFKKSF